MTGEIFYWIFNMSITAGITGVIILLIGKIRRIPRRVICFLWVIPFLRMVLPFGMGSKYSLMSLFSKFSVKTVTVFEKRFVVTASNFIGIAESYFPITYKFNILENLFGIASAVWLTGAASLILTFTIIYISTLTELKSAELLNDNVYLSDKVTAPAVYGIFKPRIILPVSYRDRDLEFILAHENMHIKREDNLRRVAAFAVVSFHWFNPLAWVFLKQYLTQTELACDEGVLAKLGEGRRREYALSLIGEAEQHNLFVSAFGGAKVRLRIKSIMSYNKITAFSLVCFILFAFAITYILLTNSL